MRYEPNSRRIQRTYLAKFFGNTPRGVVDLGLQHAVPARCCAWRRYSDTLPSIDRFVGLMVLLYAQPATRITQIRLDDVTTRDDQVFLRIAAEELPMPAPVDSLITDLITQRRNMGTAANTTSPWLLPGQRPNRPITTSRLRNRLRSLGITGTSRVAAFNELLREIPAPVLADLVGCHRRFAAERASALATDWANYAALRARPSPAHT